jgi:hypothetical protein
LVCRWRVRTSRITTGTKRIQLKKEAGLAMGPAFVIDDARPPAGFTISGVTTSQQKGDSLETAVRAIETAILRQAPGYDQKTFRIEGKKKLTTTQGVHHEIDIWVNVEIAVGYTATFIFECKTGRPT